MPVATLWHVSLRAIQDWWSDNCLRLAASLAYYTALSLVLRKNSDAPPTRCERFTSAMRLAPAQGRTDQRVLRVCPTP